MVEENEKIPTDTLSIAERLQSVGMDRSVAEAVAKEVWRASDPPATKREIDRVILAVEELEVIASSRQ